MLPVIGLDSSSRASLLALAESIYQPWNFLFLWSQSLVVYCHLLDYVVVISQFGEGMIQRDQGMTHTDPSVFYHISLFCFQRGSRTREARAAEHHR